MKLNSLWILGFSAFLALAPVGNVRLRRAKTEPEDGVKKLLSRREAASYLGLSERTVYERYRAGDLPALRVGRVLRFDSRDLETWKISATQNLPAPMPDALPPPPLTRAETHDGSVAERLLAALRAEQRETNRLLTRLLGRRS